MSLPFAADIEVSDTSNSTFLGENKGDLILYTETPQQSILLGNATGAAPTIRLGSNNVTVSKSIVPCMNGLCDLGAQTTAFSNVYSCNVNALASLTTGGATRIDSSGTLSNISIPASATTVNIDATRLTSGVLSNARLLTATTTNAGIVQLSDSTTSTSSSNAATLLAVKTAYDLADAALPKTGGILTGTLNGTVINAASNLQTSGMTRLDSAGVLSNVSIPAVATTVNIDGTRITSGTVSNARLPLATLAAPGIVQLSDSINSSSSSNAATAAAVKSAYDLANAALPRTGGTLTGSLTVPDLNVQSTISISGVQRIDSMGVLSSVSIPSTSTTVNIDASRITSGIVDNTHLTYGTTTTRGIVQLSDSYTTINSGVAATATAVKNAYDLADAALPRTGGVLTGTLTVPDIDISNILSTNGVQRIDANGFLDNVVIAETANVDIDASRLTSGIVDVTHLPAGTTLQAGIVRLSDDSNVSDSSVAATSTAVKSVYDYVNTTALSLSNYIVSVASNVSVQSTATLQSNGVVRIDENGVMSNVSVPANATTVNIDAARLTSGTVNNSRLTLASTVTTGIVQLSDAVNSTSSSTAGTSAAVKLAYDLANNALPKSGGTVTGALTLNSNLFVGSHVVPVSNVTYDLGTSNQRFRDLYLSGNSINLGGATIKAQNNNSIVAGGINLKALDAIDTYAVNKSVGTWTAVPSANDAQAWYGVCYSPELSTFVAVNVNQTTNNVMTSSNGVSWTARTSGTTNTWWSVCWAPELMLFAAVGISGTGNRVMTSPDGITWTSRTSAADLSWYGICWSAERLLFVAVAGSGVGNRVMTSPDGITWTSRTSAADVVWKSVCWSPELSLFTAVASSGSKPVMTSSDGINWTLQTAPASNSWSSVCWSSKLMLFTAVGRSGIGDRVMTSPDGITWTSQVSAADNGWNAICWAPQLSQFVAIADTGVGNRVMTSFDGVKWSTRSTSGADYAWLSVCWSPDLSIFAAVANAGARRAMVTSPVLPAPKSTLVANPAFLSMSSSNTLNALNVNVSSNLQTNGVTRIDASGALSNITILSTSSSVNIDASRLTTGILSNAVVPNLDAAKITTGTFTSNQIPSLDAAKITTGTFAVSNIPSLDAAKITTGTFTSNQIPSLDAAKITTGTFTSNQIPSLDAAKITTGTFTSNQIPSLDASKITTGTFVTARLPAASTSASGVVQLSDSISTTSSVLAATSTAVKSAYDLASNAFPRTGGTLSGALTVQGQVTLGNHIVPATTLAYDIGASNARFRDLYLSGTTIDLGGNKITSTVDGGITLNGVNTKGLSRLLYAPGKAIAKTVTGTWTPYPASASNGWNSVAWAPALNLFAAVASSGTGNRVMTSPDGITWTSRASAADNNWSSVCWAAELNLFAAVARSGTGNRVMTSPDGITWTACASAADNNWSSVCWAAELNLFVAVAFSGTGNRVMTSPDGITWTARASAADNSWNSVCWSPELYLFVAVASSGTGNRVMTSINGINWTLRTSATDSTWRSVCWSSEINLFVTVGNSNSGESPLMTSSDGTNWTTRTAAATNVVWKSVCWASELSMFVVVASSSGTGIRIMTSTDGIAWSGINLTQTTEYTSVVWSSALSIFCAVAFLPAADNTQVMVTNPALPSSKSTLIVNPAFVKMTSNNTLSITNLSVSGSIVPTSNLAYIGVSASILPTSNLAYDLGSSNMRFRDLYLSGNTLDLGGVKIKSTDSSISVGGSKLETQKYEMNVLSRSASAATDVFVTRTAPMGGQCICWAPELFMFVNISGAVVGTSFDGLSWTTYSTALPSQIWNDICWSSQLQTFVTVSLGGGVATSTNGTTWTTQTAAASLQWASVCWSPQRNLFAAVATSGTGNRVMTSPDGITWTSQTSPSDNRWRSVCWSPEVSLFVAVSDGPGLNNRIMTSPDGITWTTRTSPNNLNASSICWSAERGLFVVVSLTSDYIISSPDAVTWSVSALGQNYSLSCVRWAPEIGVFVACRRNANSELMLTSTDGKTWSSKAAFVNQATGNFNQLAWSSDLSIFVAVSNTNQTITSAPLKKSKQQSPYFYARWSFTQRSKTFTTSLYNAMFIASGNYVAPSQNSSSWSAQDYITETVIRIPFSGIWLLTVDVNHSYSTATEVILYDTNTLVTMGQGFVERNIWTPVPILAELKGGSFYSLYINNPTAVSTIVYTRSFSLALLNS